MKILTGHLTAGNKKAITAILNAGLTSGRVGKTDYSINKVNEVYNVTMKTMDRGMIPCPGSALRLSTYNATFTI